MLETIILTINLIFSTDSLLLSHQHSGQHQQAPLLLKVPFPILTIPTLVGAPLQYLTGGLPLNLTEISLTGDHLPNLTGVVVVNLAAAEMIGVVALLLLKMMTTVCGTAPLLSSNLYLDGVLGANHINRNHPSRQSLRVQRQAIGWHGMAMLLSIIRARQGRLARQAIIMDTTYLTRWMEIQLVRNPQEIEYEAIITSYWLCK